MSYPGFEDAIRRVITGDDKDGKSVVIIDGPPVSTMAAAELGGLLDIWQDTHGPLDPKQHADANLEPVTLHPPKGGVRVRWFVIEPANPDVPKDKADAGTRAAFARFNAADAIIDQTRAPGMHETHSLDVICLLQGDASLILEDGETRLKPGNIVIQRGTNHAWIAHGGPALFLAVLMDRELVRS